MVLSWSLDKIGPICRSAEDAAIVFNYVHGTDGKDLCAVDRPFNYKSPVDIKKMKIAYTVNSFKNVDSSRNEWKVIEVFKKLGAQLIPVDFPDSTAYQFEIMDIVISAESAASFDELTRSNLDDELTAQTKNDWPNQFRVSRFISAVDYITANRHRYILMQKINAVVTQFDVIICPTWRNHQTAITNLTGHPALCMPTGFDKDHLPSSITLVGKLYGEAALLEAAKLYQDATEWNKMHPDLFK